MTQPRQVAFAELGDVIAGQHIPAEQYQRKRDGTPYLTGPDDFTHRVPRITKWTKYPRSFAQEGDVLLTVKGAGCGKSNLGINAAIGRQLMALRPDPRKLDRNFLFAVIRSKERNIAHLAQGATVPGIGKDEIEQMLIPFFPLGEQRRLAALFDKADRLRRLRRYALGLNEHLLAAEFESMFGDPIRNDKGFGRERLEDLILPTRPITYGILKPGPDIPNGVPYIRVLDIQNGTVLVQGVRKTSSEIDQAYKRSRLRSGDLLLSIRGHVGRMGIVPRQLEGANITQDTARLAPIDAVDPSYLMGCLSSRSMRHLMDTLTRGAAVQGINLGDVKELPIPVPPLPLQKKFTKIVNYHTHLSAVHREGLRQAEHLFQTLLHRAFTSGL